MHKQILPVSDSFQGVMCQSAARILTVWVSYGDNNNV